MVLHDALERACADVGIVPPSRYSLGRWAKTDTLSGKSGKGDGRVIVNDDSVTAYNWQTGEKSTVRTGDAARDPRDRAKVVERIRADKAKQVRRAEEASQTAARLMRAASLGPHPYLLRKGFPALKALVIGTDDVRAIGGAYLVPEGAKRAILIPASLGPRVSSVQLIWEDGTKKFLAGGEIANGASYSLARGRETWLCEGFATGLSLRLVLRSLNRSDAVLCCFSAYNVSVVARSIRGPCWIATDCDKPMPQFEGLGTGEHWARVAGKPYTLPDAIGDDFNDVHQRDGLFAVQKKLSALLRGRPLVQRVAA